MEIWKDVVGFEGLYEVSNHGNVRNSVTKRLKQPTKDKDSGRPFLLLWKNNQPKAVRVHRLVLFAFVGPNPPKYEGCHNDGNPWNNHVSNLRWDTTKANQEDRVKHGTSNRGERCAAAKLTEDQAIAIIQDTRKQHVIAAEYGVMQNTISRIKSGKRWPHLQTP